MIAGLAERKGGWCKFCHETCKFNDVEFCVTCGQRLSANGKIFDETFPFIYFTLAFTVDPYSIHKSMDKSNAPSAISSPSPSPSKASNFSLITFLAGL